MKRSSNHWKKGREDFQSLEKATPNGPRRGAALIVALWVLIILTLLIGSFAFDMHVEARLTSYYRKRIKAQYAARAGVEWAKLVLAMASEVDEDTEEGEEREGLITSALQIQRGVGVHGLEQSIGEGSFSLDIVAEEGRRNINGLNDEDWEEILDQANIPDDTWDELIDCFYDWVDKNDEHHLNGAESDDLFYVKGGYECKNAALDTVDELLLIKGFDESVVYGAPADEEGDLPMLGIAHWLTVWGDGKVNINSASREVLMTLPEIDEWTVDDIIEGRKGEDGELGTRDDGFESVGDLEGSVGVLPEALKGKISTSGGTYLRVVSIGEAHGVRSGIWCILRLEGKQVTPVFWREENMP